jgi:hypothetical protein
MSSGVPIDKAQAVHAGGESALWKWISWNYFFVSIRFRFLTVAVLLLSLRASARRLADTTEQRASASGIVMPAQSCKISLLR